MSCDKNLLVKKLFGKENCLKVSNLKFFQLETRAISLLSRRRYWFAVAEMSPYLYWFKVLLFFSILIILLLNRFRKFDKFHENAFFLILGSR